MSKYVSAKWPNSQIPECTCSTSHNASFRTEMCTFLFWMVHCGIWNGCILGFVKLVNWVIIGAGNALSLIRRHTTTRTNTGSSANRLLETRLDGILSKFKHFHGRKCIWKCCLLNGGHLDVFLLYYRIKPLHFGLSLISVLLYVSLMKQINISLNHA